MSPWLLAAIISFIINLIIIISGQGSAISILIIPGLLLCLWTGFCSLWSGGTGGPIFFNFLTYYLILVIILKILRFLMKIDKKNP